MRDFCRVFNIKFSEKLMNCTYFGNNGGGIRCGDGWERR